jgi:hypothetical protein
VIQIAQRRAAPNAIRFVLIGPILLGIGVCISLLTPSIGDFVRGIFEISITNKLVSGSGIERASWNGQAMNVFFDTYWMGAGIGSVRASSWPIAVLASVGIAGAVMYGMFIARILCARAPALADRERGIVSAARALCVAQLITSTVAVSFMDLGLMFFGLAGVVCGSIAPRHVASEDRAMNDGTEIMGTNVERSR